MFRAPHSAFAPALFGALLLVALPAICAAAEIHDAARAGDLAAVTALVDADASQATLADERRCTPLHFAADGGHDELVAYLLDGGGDIQAQDVDGDAPLAWAAVRGHDSTIALLLDRGANIDAINGEETTALLYAVARNHHSTAKLLIERGADLELANDYGRTPLLWCTRETGDHEMAVLLLDAGANIDAVDRFGATPIELAAWRNFRSLVNLYLDRGCSVAVPDDKRWIALDNVTSNGLDRLYFALVETGIQIETTADEAGGWLHRAAAGGSAAIVGDLIERGCEIDAVDGFGWTPLHHAASRDRAEAVQLLVDKGADSELRSLSGWSPLNLAVTKNHFRTEQILQAVRPSRRFPKLEGDFVGQQVPKEGSEVFAPDIVSGPLGGHSSVTISPEGDHILWHMYTDAPDSGYWVGTIHETKLENGRWSTPRRAWFALMGDDVPFFQPDGSRLFFISRRPVEAGGQYGVERIWVMDRTEDGWTLPEPLPAAINGMPQHWLFSVAKNGDLYFASRRGDERGIFVSRIVDDAYGEAEFLGFGGSTPFISPEQEYLLTMEFAEAGRVNWIRFRDKDGAWGEPINLQESAGVEGGLCPVVSPDGKAFFYLGTPWGGNNICWQNAKFIDELRRSR